MRKVKAIIKYTYTCELCGHEWESELEHPRQCPKCWTRKWDVPTERLKVKLSPEIIEEKERHENHN